MLPRSLRILTRGTLRRRSYNPLEAGFSSGAMGPTVCFNTSYYCAGGFDLGTCIGELGYTCGTGGAASLATTVASNVFGDSCNGHAMVRAGVGWRACCCAHR